MRHTLHHVVRVKRSTFTNFSSDRVVRAGAYRMARRSPSRSPKNGAGWVRMPGRVPGRGARVPPTLFNTRPATSL